MRSSEFDEGKDNARRARNDMDGAYMSSMTCCPLASMGFDSASSSLRRVRDADNVDDYKDNLRRAVRYFNGAIGAVNNCARQGQ